MKKQLLLASIITAMIPGAAMAELTVDAYGSLRVQAESVSVDKVDDAANDDSYTGVRDAFSRFGVNASYPTSNGTTFGAKLEIPFNLRDMTASDPTGFEEYYKGNNQPRIYKLTASGDWGSIAIGKQWVAYYNYVAYPVDYFSSFYSGWSTFSTFRKEAITYTSPNISGFTFVASAVDMVDGDDDYLDTMQYAVSYSAEGLTVSASLDDRGENGGDTELLGVSASYTTGPWRFATKFENDDAADRSIYNVYGSYNLGNYTFKAHFADGDDSKDGSYAYARGKAYHLGVDYQYTKNLKVFVEYYAEEEGIAILPDQDIDQGYEELGTDGQAIAIGARYDF